MIKFEKDKNSRVAGGGGERSVIWRMFVALTMGSSAFVGESSQDGCDSVAGTTDLTLGQMFDMSTKLVSEQDEISGLKTIGWENHSWKYLSFIGDERIINLQRTKVYVFSDTVIVSWEDQQNPES